MRKRQGRIRLGAFFNPTGHHVAAWRHPRAKADAAVNFQHYVELAQTAERGQFDMIFLADDIAVREAHMEALSRSAQYIANFEPITLLSALSVATTRVGLVATASTSYNEPYHVARKFASLDHISGGRAGWNPVTSSQQAEALNFNRDVHYRHAERCERAPEHIKIMPGPSAVVGRTEAEANEQYEYLQSLIHPIAAREILSTILAGGAAAE